MTEHKTKKLREGVEVGLLDEGLSTWREKKINIKRMRANRESGEKRKKKRKKLLDTYLRLIPRPAMDVVRNETYTSRRVQSCRVKLPGQS